MCHCVLHGRKMSSAYYSAMSQKDNFHNVALGKLGKKANKMQKSQKKKNSYMFVRFKLSIRKNALESVQKQQKNITHASGKAPHDTRLSYIFDLKK